MEEDSSLKKDEQEQPPPEKCRCCLQDGELKDLWSEYCNDDGVIIYGEALVQCFALALHQPAEVVEKICESCIDKLEFAIAFKKLVAESDKQLMKQYLEGDILSLKKEEQEQPAPEKCGCCLQDGELKDLWSEYCNDDGVIIYGEALVQCFALALHQPAEVVEKICESCIDKLEFAIAFKKLVAESDKQLIKQYLEGDEFKIIQEEEASQSQDSQQSFSDEVNDYSGDEDSADDISEDVEKSKVEYVESESSDAPGSNEPTNMEGPANKRRKNIYKQYTAEDLDKCLLAVKRKEMTKSEAASFYNVPLRTLSEKLKSELPGEGPANKRGKNIYKQYTAQDLEECVSAVNTNKMTKSEAVSFYNIPLRTLDIKLRSVKCEESGHRSKIREKHKMFLQEIKTILRYTNGTPFKTKTGRNYCAYCLKCIVEPEELRNHTKTEHAGERLSGVDNFMKSARNNEIMKLDIENFYCTICPAPIDSWNDMFQHLKDTHDVELNDAYTKVIPYKWTDNFSCALCSECCDTHTGVDIHMNSHYTNYICGECGESFLAETRLKKHVETHSTSRFKCHFCPKVFALENYRKRHIDAVHSHGLDHGLVFKCRYCKEEFFNKYHRHQHVVKNHAEKIKTIACEHCEKTFTFRPYYMKHLHLRHSQKPMTLECSKCDKKFAYKYDLRKHEEWHMGVHKQTCIECNRTFSSKPYLQKHFEKVHNKTEVLVVETDQS